MPSWEMDGIATRHERSICGLCEIAYQALKAIQQQGLLVHNDI